MEATRGVVVGISRGGVPCSKNQEFRTLKSPLIEKGFSCAEYRGKIATMLRQDQQSWNKGRADAMRGMSAKCPCGSTGCPIRAATPRPTQRAKPLFVWSRPRIKPGRL